MTSIRDLVSGSLGIGDRHCLEVTVDDDGTLWAPHPSPRSPMDLVVCEGLDRLETVPPAGPVTVEIRGRIVDGRLVARVIADPGEPDEGPDRHGEERP